VDERYFEKRLWVGGTEINYLFICPTKLWSMKGDRASGLISAASSMNPMKGGFPQL